MNTTAPSSTDNLTPTQRRAIDALVDTRDIAAAAQQVGIAEEELLQWLARDSAFHDVLNQVAVSRRDESFQDIMAPLAWEWTNA